MIQLTGVTRTFNAPRGKLTALNDISMSLSSGELLCVKGPSGCGKSTLLLTAAGMLKPDSGEVIYQGKENPYMLSPDKRSLLRAELIGFVFQQFHLIPYLTIKENITAPSLTSPVNNHETWALELISQFGLEDRIDHLPSQLSTGEKQRTALARALFNKPKIIMADEPTGNLDTTSGEEIMELLLNLNKERGATLIIVTHDPEIAQLTQRVVQILDGCVVEQES